ncbi:50S ribosomal protein L32 [Buchnera aphidicola (Chaitoregma tattakana)]|uniref:50S ribosomal protein L32 n=1 Tax=Buchnera aphidicola TaxID=9 RepID=UPI0031B7EFFD
MAVQKSKHSRSKRDMRRSNDKCKLIQMSIDKSSKEVHIRHHITKKKFYRGKKFF